MGGSRLLPLAIGAAALAVVGLVAWVVSGTPGTILQSESSTAVLPTPSGADFVTVEVAPGEGAGDIGRTLEDAGVIESAPLFRILANLMGVEDEMVAATR